jgi:hypothetical protein
MVGGSFAAHPGGISDYDVHIVNATKFTLSVDVYKGTLLEQHTDLGSGTPFAYYFVPGRMRICGDPNGPGAYTVVAQYTDTGTGKVISASTVVNFLTPSRVHMSTVPGPTPKGQRYVFSGRFQYVSARTWSWVGPAGVTLVLYFRPAGTTALIPSGSTVTKDGGRFVVQKVASLDGTWSVVFPGTATVLGGSHRVDINIT